MIADRMTEAGISNMGAYMRKMALNGYVLHVDLSDIGELVALQRRCANNLNQVAVHANTYGIYPSEIAALQKDYADLWEPLSELLKKLSAVVAYDLSGSGLVSFPGFHDLGTKCLEVVKARHPCAPIFPEV